jgi:hypothetical protein
MKKRHLAAVLLASAGLAVAAQAANNYYVVVPVKGRTAAPGAPAADTVKLSLNSDIVPAATVGVAYAGYNFKPLLSVTGDPAYTGTGVMWSVSGLPAGLSLAQDGTLGGTPVSPGTPGTAQINVSAAYRGVSTVRGYSFVLNDLVLNFSNVALPSATQGTAYTYDFKNLVSVPADPAFSAANVSYTLALGVPAGFTVSGSVLQVSNAVAVGTYGIPVTAAYKTKSVTNNFSVVVKAAGYSTSRFYQGVNMSGVAVLSNEGPGALTVTDCKRTPAGGGAAVNCTAKDAWPATWPEAGQVQGTVPTDTYYISLSNGQTVVWQPSSKSLAMQ